MLGYAKKVAQLKKFDYLPEGSLEYNLLKAMKDLFEVNSSRDFIFLTEIRENVEGEFKPHTRTIAKKIDKMGFGDYRDRRHIGNSTGWGYAITKDVFDVVINSICPNLSSPSSPSSQSYIKTEEICEDKGKIGEDKREDGEAREAREDRKDLTPLEFDPKIITHTFCSIKDCSETECNFDSTKKQSN